MKTPHSSTNQDFSDKAHEAAKSRIYPALFDGPPMGDNGLSFESTCMGENEKADVLDGKMAIDRIVRVGTKSLQGDIEFVVQERFRRPQYSDKYADITITEWNYASNVPSELYKLNAGIFLYGYFDKESGTFIDWIACNTTDLMVAITQNRIGWTMEKNNRSNQSFAAIKFEDLKKSSLVILDKQTAVDRLKEKRRLARSSAA